MEVSPPEPKKSGSRDILAEIHARQGLPAIAVSYGFGADQIHRAIGVTSTRTKIAATAAHKLPISCAIKPLVAVASHYAQLSGKIDLDEDVREYLPALGTSHGDRSGDRITLRHLLTHTAGYVEPQQNDARWTMTWDQFTDYFSRKTMAFTPGTAWSYNHTGYVVLQRALEAATGQGMQSLLCDLVLTPLGIVPITLQELSAKDNDTLSLHIRSPRTGTYEPMKSPMETGFFRYSLSDFVLSTIDLAKIASFLAGGFENRLTYLDEARNALLERAICLPSFIPSAKAEKMPVAYCHGVADFGDFKGINGSYIGSTCALRFDEVTGLGLTASINAWAPAIRDKVAHFISRPFRRADTVDRPRPLIERLEVFGGAYEGLMLGAGRAIVTVKDRTLQISVERRGMPPAIAILTTDEAGHLQFIPGSADLSLSLSINEQMGQPTLMVGTSAYRKLAS